MNDEIKESWEHRIRNMAPKIKEAEESLAKADASVKKLLAELKIKAFAAGAKTSSAQETFLTSHKINWLFPGYLLTLHIHYFLRAHHHYKHMRSLQ